MVLNNLFDRGGLQQETGLLRERWGQDGSNLVSAGDLITNDTLITVSAGKTLFISQVTFSGRGTSQTMNLRDGGIGGDIRFRSFIFESLTQTVMFQSPLKFETSLYANNTGDIEVSVSGWEE